MPVLEKSKSRRRTKTTEPLVVDSFAGGGGASLGIELALGKSPHIAINHDEAAIEMHAANHPDTYHYTEDVWHVKPKDACGGRHVRLLWASPDCRHFSRAKGGKPVKKNIRGLAWVVCKWARDVRPDIICMENVREFQDWGPLTALRKNGRIQYDVDKKTKQKTPKMVPDPKRKGQTFRRWCAYLRNLGYQLEFQVLNAADYGVPTSRKRLFIIARCDGKPIVWPKPTHAKPDKQGQVPKGVQPWRAAAECIQWELDCPSIFDRKRPLADKTMRRIAMGIMRYVLENPHPFIVQTNHGGEEFRGQQVTEPMPTISAKHGFGVVDPFVVRCAHGDQANGKERWGNSSHSIHEPVPTVTGSKDFAIVAPTLVANYGERNGQQPRSQTVEQPLDTVVATPKHSLVAAALLKHYGGVVGTTMDKPVGTVTAVDHHSLLAASITKFRGDSNGTAASDPLPTITSGAGSARPAGAAHALGLQAASLVRIGQYGSDGGKTASPAEPLSTIVSKNEHCLAATNLVQFNHGDKQWRGVDEPLGVITAQGQKFGLVAAAMVRNNHGEKQANSVDEPLPTITTQTNKMGLVYALLVRYFPELSHERSTGDAGVGTSGSDRGPSGRDGLETQTTNQQRQTDSDNAQANGITGKERVSAGRGVAEWETVRDICTSTGVDSPQRTNSSGAGTKSQKGNKARQSTRRARTTDAEQESRACLQDRVTPTSGGPSIETQAAADSATSSAGHPATSHCETSEGRLLDGQQTFQAACITKYFGTAIGAEVTEPLHTQTGKHRFGLLTVTMESGEQSSAIGVYVDGIGWCVMADIGLRMLQPRELARAQGFHDDYKLIGSKSNQVAKIGNSVPPLLVAQIVAANVGKRKTRKRA